MHPDYLALRLLLFSFLVAGLRTGAEFRHFVNDLVAGLSLEASKDNAHSDKQADD